MVAKSTAARANVSPVKRAPAKATAQPTRSVIGYAAARAPRTPMGKATLRPSQKEQLQTTNRAKVPPLKTVNIDLDLIAESHPLGTRVEPQSYTTRNVHSKTLTNDYQTYGQPYVDPVSARDKIEFSKSHQFDQQHDSYAYGGFEKHGLDSAPQHVKGYTDLVDTDRPKDVSVDYVSMVNPFSNKSSHIRVDPHGPVSNPTHQDGAGVPGKSALSGVDDVEKSVSATPHDVINYTNDELDEVLMQGRNAGPFILESEPHR